MISSKLTSFREWSARKANQRIGGPVDWTDYNTLEEINDWIDGLAAANDFVKIVALERDTYEGRQQRVLVTDKAGPGAPTVWIEAG